MAARTPRTEAGRVLLMAGLTFHSGRRLADSPELLAAIEDAAVVAREAELRAEIAAMKGDLFRKSGGSEVWVQRAAVLALLTSSEGR